MRRLSVRRSLLVATLAALGAQVVLAGATAAATGGGGFPVAQLIQLIQR